MRCGYGQIRLRIPLEDRSKCTVSFLRSIFMIMKTYLCRNSQRLVHIVTVRLIRPGGTWSVKLPSPSESMLLSTFNEHSHPPTTHYTVHHSTLHSSPSSTFHKSLPCAPRSSSQNPASACSQLRARYPDSLEQRRPYSDGPILSVSSAPISTRVHVRRVREGIPCQASKLAQQSCLLPLPWQIRPPASITPP